MAEFLTLPARNLHQVPDVLTDQQACATEPLAAACRLLEQGLPPEPGTCVAVIGKCDRALALCFGASAWGVR